MPTLKILAAAAAAPYTLTTSRPIQVASCHKGGVAIRTRMSMTMGLVIGNNDNATDKGDPGFDTKLDIITSGMIRNTSTGQAN